jgi:uncharacterized BrkB/YihY/UPF0761 family membrane protein
VRLAQIAGRSLTAWLKDGAPGMGAAISFYSLFAIGPILLMVIWVAATPARVSPRMLLRPRPELRSHGLERAFMRCSRAS